MRQEGYLDPYHHSQGPIIQHFLERRYQLITADIPCNVSSGHAIFLPDQLSGLCLPVDMMSTISVEQVKLFKECQQILTKEAASVYLEDISSIYVYSMDFDGFVSYPLYAYDFSAIYKVAE